jgi:hypothetical protein
MHLHQPLKSATDIPLAITLEDLEARKRRLEQLSLGFAKEVTLIDEDDGPLLDRERQAYLKAIREALAGVESAGGVLAKVLQRRPTSSLACR